MIVQIAQLHPAVILEAAVQQVAGVYVRILAVFTDHLSALVRVRVVEALGRRGIDERGTEAQALRTEQPILGCAEL